MCKSAVLYIAHQQAVYCIFAVLAYMCTMGYMSVSTTCIFHALHVQVFCLLYVLQISLWYIQPYYKLLNHLVLNFQTSS